MKRLLISIFLTAMPFVANAQWAVFDNAVRNELIKINNIVKIEDTDKTELTKTFKAEIVKDRTKPQDITLGEGENLAKYRGIDTAFDKIPLAELTNEEKLKYIGTAEDCGTDQNKDSNMYSACLGMRNLRIETMRSTQQGLRNLFDRREQISGLIAKSRELTGENIASGLMQRYHFELQGLTSLMQADVEMVRLLLDGYKERAKAYEIQQAEAQRSTLSRGARYTKAGQKIVSSADVLKLPASLCLAGQFEYTSFEPRIRYAY